MGDSAKIILLCLLLLISNSSCITGIVNAKGEVLEEDKIIFYREDYREYGWLEYDKDSVRFKKPMQIILDFYPVWYELRATELSITKYKQYTPSEGRILLFRQALTKEQRQKFKRVMKQVNIKTITNASSFTPTSVIEDGFRLQVTLTKDGQQEKFEWDNIYVEDLVNFLVIANNVAPEKYKFYSDEEGFIEFLKQNTKRVKPGED